VQKLTYIHIHTYKQPLENAFFSETCLCRNSHAYIHTYIQPLEQRPHSSDDESIDSDSDTRIHTYIHTYIHTHIQPSEQRPHSSDDESVDSDSESNTRQVLNWEENNNTKNKNDHSSHKINSDQAENARRRAQPLSTRHTAPNNIPANDIGGNNIPAQGNIPAKRNIPASVPGRDDDHISRSSHLSQNGSGSSSSSSSRAKSNSNSNSDSNSSHSEQERTGKTQTQNIHHHRNQTQILERSTADMKLDTDAHRNENHKDTHQTDRQPKALDTPQNRTKYLHAKGMNPDSDGSSESESDDDSESESFSSESAQRRPFATSNGRAGVNHNINTNHNMKSNGNSSMHRASTPPAYISERTSSLRSDSNNVNSSRGAYQSNHDLTKEGAKGASRDRYGGAVHAESESLPAFKRPPTSSLRGTF
jgi:hypothetical protein